mgnify:CR=1 FL=1
MCLIYQQHLQQSGETAMLIPYIGITDFTDYQQIQLMQQILERNRPPESKYQLHAGVMMSRKTLRNLPTKWQSVFPPKEEIAKIFASDSAYNCLHYADYDHYLSEKGVMNDLCEAIFWGGPNLKALQLDMIWPDPSDIFNAIHASRKNIEVILQIGANALEEAGDRPELVVEKLADYQLVVQRVLLDKSMGRGLALDAEGLIPFISAIKEAFPNMGIGVAGGLGPETINLIKPLAKVFPGLSIDAQGRLRPSRNIKDPIDWEFAANYLVKASHILS